MNEENKPIKIEFAPGAFDNFDGTQEELDEIIAMITQMAESGELLEKSRVLTLDDLDKEDAEMFENIQRHLDGEEPDRKLQ